MKQEEELDHLIERVQEGTASIEDVSLWGDVFLDQPSQRPELSEMIRGQWPGVDEDSAWVVAIGSAFIVQKSQKDLYAIAGILHGYVRAERVDGKFRLQPGDRFEELEQIHAKLDEWLTRDLEDHSTFPAFGTEKE